ncbi:T9SS type A sorting domain-containing protein [Flavobacterium zepuense]|uniref:T9SS type A sorting domain-containing protein n=1 Tax=Flavobacterium zepuense TaxID=2593302 RepID=A0A552V883_9FLAO|nr:T9SS type A sorting domain-containing protein [Flavobacterium zepuense]TRW26675.1 T9SS type A sorting domain-containing protein [Flavobacterium zepuense]
MKKTLLTAMFAFACLTASAQTPNDSQSLVDGSNAPDFTAVDINGVSHSLYADYLDQGKSVVIDFSATWCGPCWNYHQTHAMADFYEAYGPNGSDEAGVIFVEGDVANTTLENIYGEQGPIAPSQGNWTIGSPYPIIEDTEALDLGAASKYDVDYFPTMYVICANTKTTLKADQLPAAQLKAKIGTCQTLTGVPNHGQVTLATTTYRICEDGQPTNIAAKLKNFGNNQITAATVVVKENGTVVATKNYTGALNQFATAASATVENVALHAGSAYTVELLDINGSDAFNEELTTVSFTVVAAEESENNIYVQVYTDNYPTEISWELKDSSGTTVFQAGPYAGSANGGGADANTVKDYYLELEGDADCYTIVYKDSYGDGWSLGTEDFKGIKVLDYAGEVIYEQNPGNFGTSLSVNSAFKTDGTMGTSAIASKKLGVYPNPTTGILNFSTTEAVDVTVTDVTGKTVYTAKTVNDGGSVNLSSLQKGMYIVQLKGATTQTTEKIIIQ